MAGAKARRLLTPVPGFWRRRTDLLLAAACFAASLLLYLRTLAPSVVALFDDSLEFPLLVQRLGIAHPTGYPLYTLLGKLFSLGAGPNVAWRLNMLSAVGAALTVSLVYALARQFTRRRWTAVLSAAALAVSPIFWSQALFAEVYTVNSALVTAMLLAALRWARSPWLPVHPASLLLPDPQPAAGCQPQPPCGPWQRLRLMLRRAGGALARSYRRILPAIPPRARLNPHPGLYLLASLAALSLTHHFTTLLLALPLLLFVVLVGRRLLTRAAWLGPVHSGRPRAVQLLGRPAVYLIGCLALPLLLYLYLPLRGHVGSLDGTYVNTWSGFWRWVTAADYRVFLGKNPLARDLDAAFYAGLFWQQFGPAGLALAAVGVIGLRTRISGLALTGLAWAAYVAFAVLYRVPDVEVFFIPSFVVVAVWIGVGLDQAVDRLRVRGPSLTLRRLLALGLVILVAASFLQAVGIGLQAYPKVDLSQRWRAHDFAREVLGEPLPANSTIVGLLGEMTLLRTFQEVWGLGVQVRTVARDDPAERLLAVEEALAAGQTVYITRSLPGLAERHSMATIIGPLDVEGETEALVEVRPPTYQVPPLPNALDLEVVPGLRLLGYGMRQHGAHSQAWARLRLWWRAPGVPAASFKVSARLLDADGQTVAAVDGEPVAWTYPPNSWRPLEVVTDAYEIPLPPGTAGGQYVPVVIVYDPGDSGTELGRVELPPVTLAGNPARPPRRELEESLGTMTYAHFAEVELLGYTWPGARAQHRPGETLPLTLLWQAHREPTQTLRVSLWLVGEAGRELAEAELGGQRTPGVWAAGQTARQTLFLRLPPDLRPGSYRLGVRVSRAGRPIPWSRLLLPRGSDLDLGTVEIAP